MKFQLKLKWWYYNSLVSVFLISHFQKWTKFTLEELLEIPLMKEGVEYEMNKLKKIYQGNLVSYSFTLTPDTKQTVNGVIIWWHDLNRNKHRGGTHILSPQYNFTKHKWTLWIS